MLSLTRITFIFTLFFLIKFEFQTNPKSKDNDWLEYWHSRRNAILARYTTAEKLSIISSFLPGGEKGW